MEILHRPRRLRINENIRELARETRLSKSSLIYPVFIREGSGIKEEIPSTVNQYHYSPDRICEEIEQLLAAGIHKILLFGIPAHKDELGSSAWQEDGAVQTALRIIKQNYPQVYCITDVCMCEYTSTDTAVRWMPAPPWTTTAPSSCCARPRFPMCVQEPTWSLPPT